MKVWVVTRSYNYEGSSVLAVFDSADKGKAFASGHWYDKDEPLEFVKSREDRYTAHVSGGDYAVDCWDVE